MMPDLKSYSDKDLKKAFDSADNELSENHGAKDMSKIGRFIAGYALVVGMGITGLMVHNGSFDKTAPDPQVNVTQPAVKAPQSRATSSDTGSALAAVFYGVGGMTLIGGGLASIRRVGIKAGELLNDGQLAALEERHQAMGAEIKTRNLAQSGIMQQTEMKLS
jgi:hypothetical protein